MILKHNTHFSYTDLGSLLSEIGCVDKAEEYHKKELELYPESDNAYHNLGFTFYQRQKFKEAEEYCLKAIKLNSKRIATYDFLGDTYISLKRYRESEKCFRKAIKLNNNKLIECNLVETLERQGKIYNYGSGKIFYIYCRCRLF